MAALHDVQWARAEDGWADVPENGQGGAGGGGWPIVDDFIQERPVAVGHCACASIAQQQLDKWLPRPEANVDIVVRVVAAAAAAFFLSQFSDAAASTAPS